MKSEELAFDDAGINVADPNDRLGHKSRYITLLQKIALSEIIGPGDGRGIEIGCGYGRMSSLLPSLGYETIAVDPSLRLLRHLSANQPGAALCVARLPELPFNDQVFDVVLLVNVLRPLHLLGIKDVVDAIPRVMAPGARLVVMDNIRARNAEHVDEGWIAERFESLGLKLTLRRAIRAGRWPGILAVRYGIVPARFHERLARWEISRLARHSSAPFVTYHNVVFVFENEQR